MAWRVRLGYLVGPCLAALLLVLSLPSVGKAQVLSVYVVPQFPAEDILQTWRPLLKKIGEQAGIRLELKFAKSIPEFETLFLAGVPDIAFMNPYHAVMARRAQAYVPIICDAQQKLTGILVVRNDANLRSTSELSGRQVAFPSPNAFGASLYMRALLKSQTTAAIVPQYVNTHSNVMRQVISGQVPAGGVIRQTFDKEPPELRAQLRILYETPSVNPHPIVVHPRVAQTVQDAIQQAFLALGSRTENDALLRSVQLARPRKASYADYSELENLAPDSVAIAPAPP